MKKINTVTAKFSQFSKNKEIVELSDTQMQRILGGARQPCAHVDDSCSPYYTFTAQPERDP